MEWRRATMVQAIQHATGRKYSEGKSAISGPEYGCDVVGFTDGTAVACLSAWSKRGGYSEYTPVYVEAEPPEWWILR